MSQKTKKYCKKEHTEIPQDKRRKTCWTSCKDGAGSSHLSGREGEPQASMDSLRHAPAVGTSRPLPLWANETKREELAVWSCLATCTTPALLGQTAGKPHLCQLHECPARQSAPTIRGSGLWLLDCWKTALKASGCSRRLLSFSLSSLF